MMEIVALPFLLAASPQAATGLGYARGADLITRCTSESAHDASWCFAYIAAVHDSVRAYEQWLNMREFCIPARTAQSDLRDVVVARIERNPNDRLGQAASVVINALKEHYPCEGSATPPPKP